MTYQERKAARTKEYQRWHGVKLVTCTACGGYRSYKNGPCGACGGTGKERDKPNVATRSNDMALYRSKHHPNNGVTYRVIRQQDGTDVLVSSSGIEYRQPVWDWSDIERVED